MRLWISFPGGGISHAAVDFLSRRGISHAAVDSLSRGSISHAAGARRGSIHSCEGHRPLLALLPSGHGKRAVARVAGKALAADRLL